MPLARAVTTSAGFGNALAQLVLSPWLIGSRGRGLMRKITGVRFVLTHTRFGLEVLITRASA